MSKSLIRCLALTLICACGSLSAQTTYEFTAFTDADLDSATGCTVTLPGLGETINGVEYRLVAQIGGQPRTVLDVARSECQGSSFGAPVSLGVSHPVGFDNGIAAGDVVEWSDARSLLTNNPNQLRLYFTTMNVVSGAEDVLLTTDGSDTGDPILLGLFFIIPTLGGAGLLLLAAVLAFTAYRNRRLIRGLAAGGLVLSAFAVWAANHVDDGQIGDWSGLGTIADDPAGDQFGMESGVDLLGCYATEENSRLYFRCDVVDIENQPPVAVDDTDSTDEDTLINAAAPGVLANDSDPDPGDMISVTAFDATSAQGAVVNVNADGSYSYDPTAAAALQALSMGETVNDTFTYTISDTFGATDTATVTVTVTGVNDPPTANDDTGSTDEDTILNVPAAGVLANDVDIDANDTLTVIAFDAMSTQGAVVNVNADGSYSYDPTAAAALQALAQGASVIDTFTYTISDGLLTDSATVSITVAGLNDAPTAVDDSDMTDEDTPINMAAPGLLGNDIEIDNGDSISVTAFDATSTQGAAVTVNADGSFNYDPTGSATLQALDTGDNVNDTFTYTISDTQGAMDTATVTIMVAGLNDPPVANDDTGATDEDTVINAAAPGVLANDTDVDSGDMPTVSAFDALSVQGAAVNVNGDGSYSYDPTAAAALQALNQSDMVMDTFTYTITDSTDFDTATVTITVTGINDAPVVNDDMVMTDEDVPLIINVLGNDTDVDGTLDPATVMVTGGPSIGMTSVNPTTGAVTYTPNPNVFGADNFTYQACDDGTPVLCDTATVSITVNSVDDPPVAVDDSATVTEDDPGTMIDVLANDTDIDGGPIGISSVTQPANGVVVNNTVDVTYTPDPNYCNNPPGGAPDTFTYTLTPGGSTATVSVTVDCVNDPPSIAAPAGPFDVTGHIMRSLPAGTLLAGASDPDGATTLIAELRGTPSDGAAVTVNADGSFDYDPGTGFTGMATFDYRVCDDGIPLPSACSADQTVTINVADIIWFIDQGHAGSNQGTLTNPFNSMGSFDAVNDNTGTNPGNGDSIFLFSGTTTEGVTLLNDQILIGQGATASISAITGVVPPAGSIMLPATGGARPLMTTTNANALTLAQNNTIRGLDVGNTGTGIGISGTGVGTITISDSAISGSGQGIDITTGIAAITFDSLGSTSSAAEGIDLDDIDGSFSITGATMISGNAQRGIQVANSVAGSAFDFGSTTVNGNSGIDLVNNTGATFTFDSLDVTTSNGPGLVAGNSGTVNVSGATNSVNATGGAGIDIVSTSLGAGMTFSSVSSTNSASDGIHLVNVDQPITINGGSVNGASMDGVNITGGNGDLTFANTVSNSAGEQVDISMRTGGDIIFSGVVSTNTGRGIRVASNTPASFATIRFAGNGNVLAPTVAGSDAVILENNNFNVFTTFSGGGLQLTAPPLGDGYAAFGAQQIAVNGNGNTITATTGTALNVIDSTIGTASLIFESINSNGALGSAIVVSNTGTSGGLSVTGTGTNMIAGNSGGTIQNTGGVGVSLNATLNPSFDSVTIMNTGGHGIVGMGVDTLQFRDGLISGAGNANGEDGIHLVNSLGLVIVDNSRFTNAAEDLISIHNTNANVDVMVTNSELIETAMPFGNDAITIQVQGSSNVMADISNNVFGDPVGFATGGLFGNAIDIGNATGGAIMATGQVTLMADGNSSNQDMVDLNKGGGFKVSGQDSMTVIATVINNTFNGAKGNGVIAFDANDSSQIFATIGGPAGSNQIDDATNSNGIVLIADEDAKLVGLVDNNVMNNIGTDAVQVVNFALSAGDFAEMDATVINNTVNGHNIGAAPFLAGVDVFGGGFFTPTCVNVTNNTVLGTPGGFFAFNLDDFGSTQPILVEGPGVLPVMPADVITPGVLGNGPPGAPVNIFGAVNFSNGVPCETPP